MRRDTCRNAKQFDRNFLETIGIGRSHTGRCGEACVDRGLIEDNSGSDVSAARRSAGIVMLIEAEIDARTVAVRPVNEAEVVKVLIGNRCTMGARIVTSPGA